MCRDLQNWGLGTFIPTITSDRKYRLNPRAPTNGSYKVARTFNSVFQKPLKETAKYLEYEMNKAETESEKEELLHHKFVINQNSLHPINDKRNVNDENAVLNPGNSRQMTSPHLSSSPTSNKLPLNSPKSLFNFSHLNNPSSTKNENTNSTFSNHSLIVKNVRNERNEKNEDNNDYNKNEYKNKNDSSSSSSSQSNNTSKNILGRKSPAILSDTDCSIEASLNNIKHSRRSIDYTLPCVLSVFDGNLTLEQAILKLPPPLRPFGVDMVVWLLR